MGYWGGRVEVGVCSDIGGGRGEVGVCLDIGGGRFRGSL